ncbi:hypothetical protein [Streptomyces sp. HNM0574]|uniref:hypothetical protein n=1 Tax=Streptomyces sp. HNM0574 TaxID=2714954 RepID=UPI00146DC759|nr:hypothetical protein [Streptomyces sp. HNM0574]NLU67896.1 hypothetical protein [Streptomyces sp. HNM0574]
MTGEGFLSRAQPLLDEVRFPHQRLWPLGGGQFDVLGLVSGQRRPARSVNPERGDHLHRLSRETVDRLRVRGDLVDESLLAIRQRAELDGDGTVAAVVRLVATSKTSNSTARPSSLTTRCDARRSG